MCFMNISYIYYFFFHIFLFRSPWLELSHEDLSRVKEFWDIKSVQFSSVAQSSPVLCDPMDCSTPSLPVHHQPPEPTQTHVHRVSDAI